VSTAVVSTAALSIIISPIKKRTCLHPWQSRVVTLDCYARRGRRYHLRRRTPEPPRGIWRRGHAEGRDPDDPRGVGGTRGSRRDRLQQCHQEALQHRRHGYPSAKKGCVIFVLYVMTRYKREFIFSPSIYVYRMSYQKLLRSWNKCCWRICFRKYLISRRILCDQLDFVSANKTLEEFYFCSFKQNCFFLHKLIFLFILYYTQIIS